VRIREVAREKRQKLPLFPAKDKKGRMTKRTSVPNDFIPTLKTYFAQAGRAPEMPETTDDARQCQTPTVQARRGPRRPPRGEHPRLKEMYTRTVAAWRPAESPGTKPTILSIHR